MKRLNENGRSCINRIAHQRDDAVVRPDFAHREHTNLEQRVVSHMGYGKQ